MIDELDIFNAKVTLALARISRVPFKVHPQLASEISSLIQPRLLTEDRLSEKIAFESMFSDNSSSIFDVYKSFWKIFKYVEEPFGSIPPLVQIAVNSPYSNRAQIPTVYDARVGNKKNLPERWSINTENSFGYVDVITLFSEDGLTLSETIALVKLVGPGTTITFVRPSVRCDFWFKHCGIRHDFSGFMDILTRRVDLETLHQSNANEAIMVTTLGAKTLKIEEEKSESKTL